MNQKLFTVDDCFKIAGRGIAVVSEFQPNLPIFKVGDTIVLIRPNNTEIITEIRGIETPVTVSGVRKIAVLIKDISREDIPFGTTVFLRK